MKKTLTIGIILTLFSTPAFAQSSPLSGLEAFLPIILIQIILMGLLWRFSARVEMRRWVYVVWSLIPFFGIYVFVYLFIKGISLILNKLDKLQTSIDKDLKGVE
jgi:hypothetical protein